MPKAKYPLLTKAPIREAIFDLRVRFGTPPDGQILEDLAAEFKREFPVVEPMRLFQGQFTFGDDGLVATSRSDDFVGLKLTSPDGSNVAQLRNNGFTFSRLKPYQSWDQLRRDAWSLWDRYREVVQPEGVTRVAGRFINEFRLPPKGAALTDYFKTPPEIPDGVPNRVTSMLYRYVLAPEDGVVSNVSLATGNSESPQEYSIMILDIDCYVRDDWVADDASIGEQFEKIRDMKNRIFYGSITPRMVDMHR